MSKSIWDELRHRQTADAGDCDVIVTFLALLRNLGARGVNAIFVEMNSYRITVLLFELSQEFRPRRGSTRSKKDKNSAKCARRQQSRKVGATSLQTQRHDDRHTQGDDDRSILEIGIRV